MPSPVKPDRLSDVLARAHRLASERGALGL
jgi:hypothetical protein